ncbi:unnamed protein product [Phytophthora lilii]|uniref:Unnamed protein product n=1 Tax=Phytophthora lilii TaxID=2077276 RepID=A0A9W6U5Y7_9STRA|nr:unnamed protein product [Phytophthora lilii]
MHNLNLPPSTFTPSASAGRLLPPTPRLRVRSRASTTFDVPSTTLPPHTDDKAETSALKRPKPSVGEQAITVDQSSEDDEDEEDEDSKQPADTINSKPEQGKDESIQITDSGSEQGKEDEEEQE